jgi:hypothetical protein
MKKLLLFAAATILSCAVMAQDTLTGWTFPVNTGTDSLNANMGTSQNMGYDIRFQWVTPNDTTVDVIFFVNGATSYAAATTHWDNAADQKYWSVKFKASGYSDIKVSSSQKSSYDGYNAGPGAFKLQWRLSSGDFADVPNGAVTVKDDWTTGKVENLPVPVTGQGTSSIYIRWIATTSNDYNGTAVTPNGISMIDDILITGTTSSGTEDIIFTNRVNVYPVPNNGRFTVDSKVSIKTIRISDISGHTIYSAANPGSTFPVDLGNVSKGSYIMTIGFSDTDKPYTVKFQVD